MTLLTSQRPTLIQILKQIHGNEDIQEWTQLCADEDHDT